MNLLHVKMIIRKACNKERKKLRYWHNMNDNSNYVESKLIYIPLKKRHCHVGLKRCVTMNSRKTVRHDARFAEITVFLYTFENSWKL